MACTQCASHCQPPFRGPLFESFKQTSRCRKAVCRGHTAVWHLNSVPPAPIPEDCTVAPPSACAIRNFHTVMQYMGNVEDTKRALIASGVHNSKSLRADKFTYKNTDYVSAVEDAVGVCGGSPAPITHWTRVQHQQSLVSAPGLLCAPNQVMAACS